MVWFCKTLGQGLDKWKPKKLAETQGPMYGFPLNINLCSWDCNVPQTVTQGFPFQTTQCPNANVRPTDDAPTVPGGVVNIGSWCYDCAANPVTCPAA